MFEPEEKVWIRKILAFQGDEIAITKANGAYVSSISLCCYSGVVEG
jgi:hypothetical protein